ncbi:fumarylacetoacetate hydrolase family protein [Aliiroseovarius sp. YM-037]|uniref:fumarylacetoacetate hydrolase family protein n=1 Tax=Aliiroseovarius sp. YM-037 TaxID=3341728 RepID=UPI003A7FE530
MTDYVFPPAPTPSVAVADSDARFPVRRIFCVGRNYAEHAREMGNDPEKEPPFFFTKPADALVGDGTTLPYPARTENLHHEAELVVAIGKGGKDIDVEDAQSHIWGYAPGNDLTRRDMQSAAKTARRPWDMAKGFDQSAACGAIHPASVVGHPEFARITCVVNGETRQESDITEMIWPAPFVVSYLSGFVELAPGDLIYTGTPAGVGPLVSGDVCRVEIAGLGAVEISYK